MDGGDGSSGDDLLDCGDGSLGEDLLDCGDGSLGEDLLDWGDGSLGEDLLDCGDGSLGDDLLDWGDGKGDDIMDIGADELDGDLDAAEAISFVMDNCSSYSLENCARFGMFSGSVGGLAEAVSAFGEVDNSSILVLPPAFISISSRR